MFTPITQPQTPYRQQETLEKPDPLPKFNLDQLNHHVLLTVQAVNQAAAIVNVRGA